MPRGVADRLGFQLLDDELPKVVAARLGTSPEVVESIEYRPPGFGERLMRSLGTAVPETFAPAPPLDELPQEAQREVERLIRDAADDGDVVIVGRIANAILGPRENLVRVFLNAPLAWRIQHVQRWLGYGEAQSRAEIARVDASRATYARERYDVAFGHPKHYDLVINVGRFGIEGAVGLIVAAVEAARA